VYESLLDVLRSAISHRGPAAAQRWFRHLLAIQDRTIRTQLLADRISKLDAHFAFIVLSEVINLSLRRDPRGRELLLDLTTNRPLAETLGYSSTRRIYELAREHSRDDVARLFLSTATLNPRAMPQRFLAIQNQHMQDTSIGWRKKLARGSDRMKLDQLLFDRNSDVIRILLANPRIIERDVVRIAAMRPANPENLVVIFQNAKWVSRYHVKVALACNPWSPIDVALACLPHLMTQNLSYAASNEKLAPEVREAAAQLLGAATKKLSD
jgi:hypothetical protein